MNFLILDFETQWEKKKKTKNLHNVIIDKTIHWLQIKWDKRTEKQKTCTIIVADCCCCCCFSKEKFKCVFYDIIIIIIIRQKSKKKKNFLIESIDRFLLLWLSWKWTIMHWWWAGKRRRRKKPSSSTSSSSQSSLSL